MFIGRGASPSDLGEGSLSWVWGVRSCGYWSGFTCVYIHNLEGDFEPTSFMSANCVCSIGVLRFTCGFFSVSRDPSQKQEPLSGGLLPWNPHWLATAAPSPWLFCFSKRCFSSHLVLRSRSIKKKYCKSKPSSLQIILKWTGKIDAAVSHSLPHSDPPSPPNTPPAPVSQSPCCLDNLKFSASWVCLIRNRLGSASYVLAC